MTSKESEHAKSQNFRFQEGERVLCFHGPLIYEAKCLKMRRNNEGVCEYYIHYAGWNKSWDEWITDTRMLKYNEQNLARQKELTEAQKEAKRFKGKYGIIGTNNDADNSQKSDTNANDTEERSNKSKLNANGNTDTLSESSSNSGPSKKRKLSHESTVETEEQFLAKAEIKVKMPDELKPWLVDDWDLICRQRKIVKLPAKPTVDEILENYVKHKMLQRNASSDKDSPVIQVANGIKEYFNTTLGSKLLYRSERVQYADILDTQPGVPMSSIYGATHLLRLFVILGGLLVYTPIDERTVQVLQTYLFDFLKYMQKQSNNLFNFQNYQHTTGEYQRKLMEP